VFLSTTTCAIYPGAEFENKNLKSATFISKIFEVGPGKVAAKTFFDIEFPKGHVGIKSFDAELVDEGGNSVPLYEAYLHHFFAIKYHAIDWNMSKIIPKDPLEGNIYIRNDGTCGTYILPYYWGLGGEARGTKSKIPDPYAVEHGNPSTIPSGYQEKWLLNTLVIDTRGTKDRKRCTECRCNHFNLPKNFYNVTTGIDGKPLGSSYKGGLFCCQDNLQCKLKEGFEAPTRKLALRYKITWVDWNQQQIPVRFYVLDSTDRVTRNGSQVIHDCKVNKFMIFFSSHFCLIYFLLLFIYNFYNIIINVILKIKMKNKNVFIHQKTHKAVPKTHKLSMNCQDSGNSFFP
jgi:hypothetical protein